MKKLIFYIIAAAAVLAACTKEAMEPVEKLTGRTVIYAGTPEPATGDSRTEMGDKSGNSYPTWWSVGDCISINGCSSQPLASEDIGSDARMARFDIDGIIDAPFEAVYPLSAVASYFDGAYTISLPSSQNYTEGSFDPDAAVMLASGSESLAFQNVLSYLKLTVSYSSTSATIKSLRIVARGGEPLSGDFTAVFGSSCSLSATSSTSSAVNVDCGEGVALGTPIVVAIPAQTYTEGFDIYVYTTDKTYQKATSSLSFTAAKGKIYSTGFNYSETGAAIGIWTEEDLIAFLSAADGGVTCSNYYAVKAESEASFGDISDYVAADGKVHILDDITLTKAVDWSATVKNRKNSISNFRGHIDGEGHTITVTSTWTAPMIINLYGTVENLSFEGNFVASHAAQLGSPIVNVLQEGGVLRNVVNKASVTYSTSGSASYISISGVVAYLAGGELDNCINRGDITCGGTASGTYVPGVGGVVGWTYQANGTGVIRNCSNFGSISVTTVKNGDTPSAIMYTGGVVGYITVNSITCSGCTNWGSLDPGTSKYFGGIVGAARSNFSDCHNYGTITQASDNTTATIGGITNFLGAGYTMTGCTNHGTINAGGATAVGGIITNAYGTVKACHNYGTIVFDGNDDTIAGGICRRVESAGSLLNCSNYADFAVGSKYFGAITASNQGTMRECANYGNITFARSNSSASGIACVNESAMDLCANYGSITSDTDYCNIGGVSVSNYAVLDSCYNQAPITVTGHGSIVGGICFDQLGGSTVSNCANSGNITFNVAPSSAGEISFAGGIVGMVSGKDFTRIPSYTIFATASDGRYGPANTTHTTNVLSSPVTISNCKNTATISMTSTPSGGFLRNVALAGILAWNWAASDADNYLTVYKCVNGTSGTTEGRIEFIQNTASSYIAPLMAGIVGSSAPYNTSNSGSCLPYTPGYAVSKSDLGFKAVIEDCENYGDIRNMNSWSNGGTTTTHRNLRPHAGIVAAAYGNSDDALHVQVKNCTNAAYILIGYTSAKGGTTTTAWISGDYQSRMNVAGGIVGVGAFVDVEGCTSSYSAASTYGVGSETRYVLASGGVIGAALEKYSVKNCIVHPKMGYFNKPGWDYWGLIVGATNLSQANTGTGAVRTYGYTTLSGSEISGNKVNPVRVKVKGVLMTIDSSNYMDYLISPTDAANNATNNWLTLSGNTWE